MSRVRRLRLTDFRNHAALDLSCDAQVVSLVGENGTGKTNILEALSLLAPGRGLRRAEASALPRLGGPGTWTVLADVTGAMGAARLGLGLDAGGERRVRIDGESAPSSTAFAEHIRLLWLTPDNDALFRGPPGDRRRFLDRLVLAVDADHGRRVSAMERALRSRQKLLEEGGREVWLEAVERELAEVAVAVAAGRRETVERLGAFTAERREAGIFPWASIRIEGTLEEALADAPARATEDLYRTQLRAGRARDRAAGRALTGPNASDLHVVHGPGGMPAGQCSTGEQKALLLGLVLAHARLTEEMTGMPPVLLLDEVAAHLDPKRREALLLLLHERNGQVWLTGTEPVGHTGHTAPLLLALGNFT
jgi:DNA replication and repair protein RecF